MTRHKELKKKKAFVTDLSLKKRDTDMAISRQVRGKLGVSHNPVVSDKFVTAHRTYDRLSETSNLLPDLMTFLLKPANCNVEPASSFFFQSVISVIISFTPYILILLISFAL